MDTPKYLTPKIPGNHRFEAFKKKVLAQSPDLADEPERLDELIHDLKSKEASAINTGGVDEQLQYVFDTLGEEEAIKALNEVSNEEIDKDA